MGNKIILSLAFFLLLIGTVSAFKSEGLVAYWKFDNSTTDGTVTLDNSSHKFHGNITNTAVNDSGKIHEGYSFNGVDSYETQNDMSYLNYEGCKDY